LNVTWNATFAKYGPRCLAVVVHRDAQSSHVQFQAGPKIIVPFDDPNGEYEELLHGWTYQATDD